MFRQTTLRAAAALAVLGALALAGCGGGSSQSMGPLPAAANGNPTMTTSSGAQVPMGTLSITLPNTTSAQAQSSGRATALSSAKKPTYIDTTTQNSAIVVVVTPQNPAEAAQYGNLTICYNLYTGGTLAPKAPPNFTYTAVGNNATTVTIAIPAPPGTDGYQITQYAGQCGGTPYSLPTAPPGIVGASNVLAQTPVTYADIEPGVVNNLNNQIANCPAQTVPCPLGLGGVPVPPAGTLAASIAIANIAFGAMPIANPVREQGAFLLANGQIGVPIPLEALNAGGVVVPGLTTAGNLLAGAGPFPSGVTVTSNDATANTTLYLVDATNGAIAQKAASNAAGLSIHEFNALSGAPATGGNDITFGGSTAVAGDPWVIIMAYSGAGTAKLASVTVTATATIPPAVTPTSITTTITPQSAVYTAAAPPNGYADLAAPAAPVGLISAAGATYFTDGNKVKIDGTATVSGATGTALGALTYAQWPNSAAPVGSFIYAVDQGQASGSTGVEANSGVYAYNPATLVSTGVSAQAGSGQYVQFNAPVAAVQALGPPIPVSKNYLFVIDKTGAIYRLDIQNNGVADGNGFQAATNVAPPLVTTGTAISPGAAKVLGTATLAGGQFLVADPGNNRIAQVDATQSPAVITTWASGAPFTGLFLSGASAYATSTTGQIYYISAAGATPVSFNLVTGGTADGPIGQLGPIAPASSPTLTPVAYPLQFKAASFFDQTTAFAGVAPYAALAAPYTVLPFAGTKVFAAAPAAGVGLIADTSVGAATGAGKINATGGIIVVAPGAAAAATVTPDSILFVDSAGATGKLRTLVR